LFKVLVSIPNIEIKIPVFWIITKSSSDVVKLHNKAIKSLHMTVERLNFKLKEKIKSRVVSFQKKKSND